MKYMALFGAVALTAITAAGAQAATVAFSYAGVNGYTAAGSFSYDAATAPASFSDKGKGALADVKSFSIAFYDPAHGLLESGSSVVGGVSSDSFFRLDFNTVTNTIIALDADIGGTYAYFLTNLRTPTGSVVAPGVTGFNFFRLASANAALDMAASLSASPVPAPSAVTGVFAGLLGLMVARRRATRG